jgi:hypothetical protein
MNDGDIMFSYTTHIKHMFYQNLTQLKEDVRLRKPYIIKKVESYCEKWGDDFDSVINEIITNDRFARFFIKDPKKQNVYESIFLNHVNGIGYNISKLTSHGKNAVCLDNDGNIVYGSSKINTTKSMDFIGKDDDGNITYYYHKYTNEAGGAQDNQYNDVVHFLTNASKNNDDITFVAVCDGNYYKDKMEELKSICGNNVKVMTIDDF